MTQTQTQTKSGPDMQVKSKLDVKKLDQKYQQEREKRLHQDGINQYRSTNDEELQRFGEDPWANPEFKREPVKKEVDVIIVGGGFGGLLAAARLVQAGVNDFIMIEKGAGFGGAWYYNRYPGVACDVESYIYLPLLEEMAYIPSEKYTRGEENRSYAEAIGHKFGLYKRMLFQTKLDSLDWQAEDSRWLAQTSRGDEIHARFFVSAGGTLHLPKFPAIDGITEFEGKSFHTSRWDFEYTGGSIHGGLDKLKDKRVAVLGTGASAVQIIPHLGRDSQHLYVFQRTPSAIDVRSNLPTDPKWAAKLDKSPGWRLRRKENFNKIVNGEADGDTPDLVSDGWTKTIRKLGHWSVKGDGQNETVEKQKLADHEKMEEIRHRVEETIEDEEVAEKLKPWYNLYCKRPCFNNDYLPTFNRDNVSLVDTSEATSFKITKNGITVDGEEFEADCIIFASGFEVFSDYCQRVGITVRGENNTDLHEKWGKGVSTYHGLFTHNFPNALFMELSQSGFTVNNTHQLDEQSTHIAYVIQKALQDNIASFQATKQAEDEWVKTIVDLAKDQSGFIASGTPGFYNLEGDSDRWLRGAPYGKGSPAFFKLLKDWREDGQFEGLEVKYAHQQTEYVPAEPEKVTQEHGYWYSITHLWQAAMRTIF